MCSHIPWKGPLAAVQVAHIDRGSADGGNVIQPSSAQLQACSMSGIYVGTADKTLLANFQVSHASGLQSACDSSFDLPRGDMLVLQTVTRLAFLLCCVVLCLCIGCIDSLCGLVTNASRHAL